MDYRKGSHSLFDLKYHIVFCTKYHYRVLTGQVATKSQRNNKRGLRNKLRRYHQW